RRGLPGVGLDGGLEQGQALPQGPLAEHLVARGVGGQGGAVGGGTLGGGEALGDGLLGQGEQLVPEAGAGGGAARARGGQAAEQPGDGVGLAGVAVPGGGGVVLLGGHVQGDGEQAAGREGGRAAAGVRPPEAVEVEAGQGAPQGAGGMVVGEAAVDPAPVG